MAELQGLARDRPPKQQASIVSVETLANSESIQLEGSVLHGAPVGMLLSTPTGRILWANLAAGRILDRDLSALIGASVLSLQPEDEAAFGQLMAAKLLAGDVLRSEGEERWCREDGSLVWLQVSLSLAIDRDGEPIRVERTREMCLIRQLVDVTARKQQEAILAAAQAELERRNAELERSNEGLQEFANVISRDLSEPLRVIAGHVQLLEQRYGDQLDADAHEWIAFAVDACTRMRSLISDLLRYSRADGGDRGLGGRRGGNRQEPVACECGRPATPAAAPMILRP